MTFATTTDWQTDWPSLIWRSLTLWRNYPSNFNFKSEWKFGLAVWFYILLSSFRARQWKTKPDVFDLDSQAGKKNCNLYSKNLPFLVTFQQIFCENSEERDEVVVEDQYWSHIRHHKTCSSGESRLLTSCVCTWGTGEKTIIRSFRWFFSFHTKHTFCSY